jgi:hypothetical protein
MLQVDLQKYLEPSAPLQHRHFARAHTHTYRRGKLKHDDESVKISPTPAASKSADYQRRLLVHAALHDDDADVLSRPSASPKTRSEERNCAKHTLPPKVSRYVGEPNAVPPGLPPYTTCRPAAVLAHRHLLVQLQSRLLCQTSHAHSPRSALPHPSGCSAPPVCLNLFSKRLFRPASAPASSVSHLLNLTDARSTLLRSTPARSRPPLTARDRRGSSVVELCGDVHVQLM